MTDLREIGKMGGKVTNIEERITKGLDLFSCVPGGGLCCFVSVSKYLSHLLYPKTSP